MITRRNFLGAVAGGIAGAAALGFLAIAKAPEAKAVAVTPGQLYLDAPWVCDWHAGGEGVFGRQVAYMNYYRGWVNLDPRLPRQLDLFAQ